MSLKVIILAAGKGSRMLANLPKVLHPLGGIPLLGHVIHTARRLNPAEIVVIYSPEIPEVKNAFPDESVTWVPQAEQLGTGHAVLQALPHLSEDDRVLVLYGDVPLITKETLEYLISSSPLNGMGLLVANVDDPTGLGRIVRDESGHILQIVEHKDANPTQLRIKEINTGIITVDAALLMRWLPELKNNNQQSEYYLTDLVGESVKENLPVVSVSAFSAREIQGVNNRWQLGHLERFYQELMAKRYSLQGVTIKDYRRFDIRGREVTIGADVEIDINVVISGQVSIGTGTYIGPNVVIEDSQIGEAVYIDANAVIRGSIIGDNAEVGPFVHLREGTRLGEKVRVGNFVEIKNSEMKEGAAAKHLSYIGDAEIGSQANIGAGMITCNYDGKQKQKTKVGDRAFVGANTTLVAPIEVGANAIVAAGTTLTRSIADNSLGIAREKQRELKNYRDS